MTPQESFLKKAIAKHGDTYDYSQTFYVASHENVNIICKKHGVFSQKAYSHIAGKGCSSCSYEYRSKKQSYTEESFATKANIVHNNKYDYSLVVYRNNKTNIKIICPDHGDFLQSPSNHIKGQGCPECGINKTRERILGTTESFIKKANKVHNSTYGYESVDYCGNKINVRINCLIHGDFFQAPSNHLQGAGCPECAKTRLLGLKLKSTAKFVEEATEKHNGRYDYSLTNYKKSNIPVKIICNEHGVFEQIADDHLSGHGCKKCAYKENGETFRFSQEYFISKAKEIYGDKYDYSKSKYIKSDSKITITCKIHGDFTQRPIAHLNGHSCPKCAWTTTSISKGEQELCDYVSSIAPCIYSDRALIKPLEIDCLVTSKKLGIEFCGVYYHSDKYKDNTYHLDKLKLTEAQGFGLIQIFDDEWNTKKDIVKSIIANRLGAVENTVYARKTRISYVERKDSEIFLNDNHIQGYVSAPIRIGLFHDDILVMLATFSNKRESVNKLDENWYELVRLCARKQTSIVGGFSKLMSFFIKNHHPSGIKTFCDKRYFNGSGYEKVGFVKSHETIPSYYYVKSGARYSRYLFQKHKLSGILKNYDSSLSERENMILHNYHRIYDCGLIVYKYSCE